LLDEFFGQIACDNSFETSVMCICQQAAGICGIMDISAIWEKVDFNK
jgi:hypothetical protein